MRTNSASRTSRRPLTVALGAVFFLSACTNSIWHIATLSENTPDEKLPDVPLETLCRAYGYTEDERLRQEIERRGDLTAAEWAAIDRDEFFAGMSEAALHCSQFLDTGNLLDSYEASKGRRTIYYQDVAPSLDSSAYGPRFIFIDNGVVIGHQFGEDAESSICQKFSEIWTRNCYIFESHDLTPMKPESHYAQLATDGRVRCHAKQSGKERICTPWTAPQP